MLSASAEKGAAPLGFVIGLTIWLIGALIFFFILYLVIQTAVDNSELAQTLRNIERLLAARPASPERPLPERGALPQEDGEQQEVCPGCGAHAGISAEICPACGLRLGGTAG